MHDVHGAHPSLDELTAFDRGLLQPSERDVIERHIAACEDCCHRLESVGDDSLVTLLRWSAGGEPRLKLEDTCDVLTADASTPRKDDSKLETAIPAELIDHPRYRVLGLLGSGGMGVVFKAEHRLMRRTVALKVIHERLIERADAVERFRQELRAAAYLCHPNIVAAYDAEQAGDIHFHVMEFVEGTNLDHLVRTRGPLPVASACHIARQVALGLQHAFERGMVHRDIKPANVLVTPAGGVKVLDFGLARFVRESGGSLTVPGAVVGTPDYVAPEQALDSRQADIRADIYSLGCTLYFLLAGRPPYPDGSALQKLLAHQQGRPRPLSEIRDDVPRQLVRVLDRMMAADPAKRYPTPAEVAAALVPFLNGQTNPPLPLSAAPVGDDRTSLDFTGLAKAETAGPQRPQRGRAANAIHILMTVVAGILVLVAVGTGVHWWHVRTQEKKPNLLAPLDERAGGPYADGEVDRLDARSGKLTRALFSPDARLALVVGSDFDIHLWNVGPRGKAPGWKQGETAVLRGHTGRPMGLAFARDGRHALSGGMDKTVRLWDLNERRLLRTMEEHTSWVRGVDFVGEDLRAVSAGNDGRVLFWDARAGTLLHEFPGHEAVVYSISASRSGRFAVSASMDRTVRVWDIAKLRQDHCLRGHEDSVTCAVLSGDDRHVLSGSADSTAIYWDLESEKPLHVLRGHTQGLVTVAISDDNRLGLSGSLDGVICLWDLKTGAELRRYTTPGGAGIRSVVFSRDLWIISAADDGVFRFWILP
ncbi:MAG TPA: serine/threonine-protein kinase [Gemmataceae bacterium]|jgi:serine/threonine protein kinase